MNIALKPLINLLTPAAKRALEASANVALSRTHHEIDIEHVLLEIVQAEQTDAQSIFYQYDVDCVRLQQQLLNALARLRSGNTRTPVLSQTLPQWLQTAWLIASVEFGAAEIRTGFLILALLKDAMLRRMLEASASELLKIDVERLARELKSLLPHSKESHRSSTSSPQQSDGYNTSETPTNVATATLSLDKYTVNLVADAKAGKIDTVLGRDREIRAMIDILMRRRQNNPILTGEPGVGKTALAEGLALRIAQGDVPEVLKNVHLRTLDLGLLQAGASVKGEFENRLRGVIDEVKASLIPIILFIDEAHTLIGAGGAAGQNDAANLLKPALARGELRTIAATTAAEYKKYFEKDAALARRFQQVKVEEPDEDNAMHMIRSVAASMSKHHKVTILEEAVRDAVKLSNRYLTGRQQPDKGVSVLDTACARVALSKAVTPAVIEDLQRLIENAERELAALNAEPETVINAERIGELTDNMSQWQTELADQQSRLTQQRELLLQIDTAAKESNLTLVAQLRKELHSIQGQLPLAFECVDSNAIADVIAAWTGVPLGRMVHDELSVVTKLDTHLRGRVLGQDHALKQIASRIQISKAGLEDPGKPIGVFMLVGPSGVGKTETAHALSETLYGGERNLITINMSEYQEAHTVSGLKGSPPGYVGYGEGGVLTEAVRRAPYSVVLLDEIEKAHPDVMELFYQVFDKGRLEDAEGREIDFKNTIILLTSNVGSETISRAVEHGVTVDEITRPPTEEDLVELIRPALLKTFKPAFLGRMKVVPYYPVLDDVLREIVTLKLNRAKKRIEARHRTTVTFTDALVDFITQRCTESDSGARLADNIINDTVLTELSTLILDAMSDRKAIENISMDAKSGELKLSLKTPSNGKKARGKKS